MRQQVADQLAAPLRRHGIQVGAGEVEAPARLPFERVAGFDVVGEARQAAAGQIDQLRRDIQAVKVESVWRPVGQ